MGISHPKRSVLRPVGSDETRRFSSFEDIAAWAVECGRADNVETILKTPSALWGDMLFAWYTQGQVACVFATALARDPQAARWFSALIEGPWDAEHITGLVDAAAKSGAEAIQILIPSDSTWPDALRLTTILARHPRWRCVDVGWLEGESGDSLQVGLRWESEDRKYESWALGIAPFEPMPFTRRFLGSPFVAIVLRPTPPIEDRAPTPKGETGLDAAHLAHMDDGLGENDSKRAKWTEGTKKAKRALISPEPLSRARARVTFAFPSEARAALSEVFG